MGEGSLVTVSSSPTLQRNVIVTPTPRAGCSRACPVRSECAASISDDAFFSSSTRSGGEQSIFHSLSFTLVTTPLTEELLGSRTVVLPTTRLQGSCLNISAEASRSAGLSRSHAVRTRRDGASSVSFSSSLSGVDSTSDKEKLSNHNSARSYSEYNKLSPLEATLGQLTYGPPMAPPSLARLPIALPSLKRTQALQIHQPAQLHMRRYVLLQSCPSLHC